MIYSELLPDPRLSIYVDYYWILVSAPEDIFDPEVLMPDVACHLIFSPGKKPYIIGMRTRIVDVQQSGNGHCVLGIKFKPGGFYALFHTSPEYLTNEIVDARDLDAWQDTDRHPYNSLSVKNCFDELLLSYIKKARYTDKRIILAADVIEKNKGKIDINSVRSQCFLSERQFERLFKKYAGISAKKYTQVVRFNNLLETMQNKPHEHFSALACDLGYYDEAHLSHDFQKFAGVAPGQFFSKYKMSVLYKNS